MAINDKQELTYKEFEAVIATYKEQNPAKYELKKEALEAKLAALKPAKKAAPKKAASKK